jgi:hypothetical protein
MTWACWSLTCALVGSEDNDPAENDQQGEVTVTERSSPRLVDARRLVHLVAIRLWWFEFTVNVD